jgi:hypothetical protein
MKRFLRYLFLNMLTLGLCASTLAAAELGKFVTASLDRPGENREQLHTATDRTPAEQHAGIRFLVAYMPHRDLPSHSAEMLLGNVRWACQGQI